MNDLKQELQATLKGARIETDYDISRNTTLKMKVRAKLYVEARTKQEIVDLVTLTHKYKESLLFLGGGSNVALLEDEVGGVVVRNYYISKSVVRDFEDEALVRFSSGYPISRVVVETTQYGLSGFEYHLGLPGTIGGAIHMNSKWTHPVSYIGDNLVSAEIVDFHGTVRTVDREYFQFAYDHSKLQETGELVLDAFFLLKKVDPEVLKKRSQDALAYRKETQPFGVATCGCFFRNITGGSSHGDQETSAGYYIDKSGLKNTQIGDFIVSDKHANFIINRGDGKPEDLKRLLRLIKSTVHKKFGITLKEEVVIL